MGDLEVIVLKVIDMIPVLLKWYICHCYNIHDIWIGELWTIYTS